MEKKHKHCELIKAWAEGATIEYKDPIGAWVTLNTSPQWREDSEYRIKHKFRMTKEHWQRVIDEEFLFTDPDCVNYYSKFEKDDEVDVERVEVKVCREIGIRQPHFMGDEHPTGEIHVVAYRGKDRFKMGTAENIFWDEVTEYIVLEESE